jgi:hypothetical protein
MLLLAAAEPGRKIGNFKDFYSISRNYVYDSTALTVVPMSHSSLAIYSGMIQVLVS